MAIFHHDPVDTPHSVIGPLFRRAAVFYLTGLGGVFAGIFCKVFADLDSYIDPHSAIIDVGEATTEWGLAWPIMIQFKVGSLTILTVPLLFGAFYAAVINDEVESDLWFISTAAVCTLIAFGVPSGITEWLLLGCMIAGYFCLTWVSLQRKWPHVLERTQRLFTFGAGEKQFERSPEHH